MIEDLVKVQDKVKYLLEKYPETRDSDKVLWLAYNCVFNYLKETIETGNYSAFKNWLCRKDTPVFESLSRARRKVQEEHPRLSGDKPTRMQEAEAVKGWAIQ